MAQAGSSRRSLWWLYAVCWVAFPVRAQTVSPLPRVERLQQEEVLRLEAEQRAYVDSLKALPPPARLELQRRLDQQRATQRALQRQQVDRALLWNQRLQARPPAGSQAQRSLLMQQYQSQQNQWLLQQKLQRSTWPYPGR